MTNKFNHGINVINIILNYINHDLKGNLFQFKQINQNKT